MVYRGFCLWVWRNPGFCCFNTGKRVGIKLNELIELKKFVKEVIAGASAQVHFFRFLEEKWGPSLQNSWLSTVMLRKVVDVPPCRSRPVGASPSSSSRLRLHLLLLLQLLQDPRHHHQLRATHSEGESLREGGKKRLGGNMHPQNGDIGGCVASCVASEDYTINQLRTLGGPDHISCWATSPWHLMW